MSELLIKGAAAIGKVIGESRDSIANLVDTEGLPAWQKNGRGPWKALPSSLNRWLEEQEKKHLYKKTCQ